MSDSLGRMTTGAAIALFGTVIYIFFEFIIRISIARFTTPSEYGSFNIGFALLNILVLLSCLGLQGGVIRCNAYLKGKRECNKIAGIIDSSLKLSILAGMLLFFSIFIFSDYLANILHIEPPIIIKLFAIAIPFLATIEIVSSVFIGLGMVKKKVIFRDILTSLLKFSGVGLALIFGFNIMGIISAYVLSIIIAALLLTIYAYKKLSRYIKIEKIYMRKKLIYFSIPLLISTLSAVIMTRVDTLIIGYFKSPELVGLYNAATPIAQLISIVLSSMALMYVPISSHLYSKGFIKEMRQNYATITKWLVGVTLPLFFIIFFFPKIIILVIFGPPYVQAASALRIIAIGTFVQVFFGPNAATLTAVGKTKLNMIDDLIGVVVNITLNLFLIPTMGIIGAAIASVTSLSLINILKTTQIFLMYRIHSFTMNNLKPMVFSTILCTSIYFIVNPVHSKWLLVLLLFLFIFIYCISLFITKSLDEEDIVLLSKIEKVTGINFLRINNIFGKHL